MTLGSLCRSGSGEVIDWTAVNRVAAEAETYMTGGRVHDLCVMHELATVIGAYLVSCIDDEDDLGGVEVACQRYYDD